MNWGNAFVRSKTIGPSGEVTGLTVELHLDGDFRKTKKKITWLAQSSQTYPLTHATLLDYDYLITKKKLEEDDNVADFVTPVSEFREEAFTDANPSELKKGDIIQFERKGYFIFDGTDEGGRLEFIRIPDGRAANLASKAVKTGAHNPVVSNEQSSSSAINEPHIDSKMYKVAKVYGDKAIQPDTSNIKMYSVHNVYK